jgi:hypothetical protein
MYVYIYIIASLRVEGAQGTKRKKTVVFSFFLGPSPLLALLLYSPSLTAGYRKLT